MALQMKVGAEDKKKVAILGGLVVVAVVVYLFNSGGSGAPEQAQTVLPAAPRPVAATAVRPAAPITRAAVRANDRTLREFRPSLKPKKPEDRPDPTSIDPTLRLDLLAKVQGVSIEGSHRNVFEFGQAPPPKVDPVRAANRPAVPSPFIGPQLPPKPEQAMVAAPPPPQAPPVPLKFYGYVSGANQPGKRAFFVDGEEVHVVLEGDTVKQRYKIVRIGVNSVIVEDIQFKSQQTLPLEEQPG